VHSVEEFVGVEHARLGVHVTHHVVVVDGIIRITEVDALPSR
jgi:hypothetical protein